MELREKVIKGLERIRDYDPMFRVAHDDEFSQYAADALALLKAQEAVEPKQYEGTSYCGNCGDPINKLDNYCHECGRAVKWE